MTSCFARCIQDCPRQDRSRSIPATSASDVPSPTLKLDVRQRSSIRRTGQQPRREIAQAMLFFLRYSGPVLMSYLADAFSDLLRLLRQWAQMLADLTAWDRIVQSTPTRLREVRDFGSNLGNLRMFTYAPDPLPSSAALVVVLHGCTQTAVGYDYGAGWSTLADRYAFDLLFPEQQPSNNLGRCFKWFQPEDSARDHGEALSIRQMIEYIIRTRGIDRRRVFVTGLSAGGAMTSVMLATYPELFAGGAIIAGLPYGSAHNVPEAFDRMRGHGAPDDDELAALVREASRGHRGDWPTISVWHGTAD